MSKQDGGLQMSRPPNSNSPCSRATAQINPRLEKNLAAYIAAAGAAGLGLLAAPQLAEGKVVYTPANIAVNGTTNIDLNHDGLADFVLGYHELDKSIVLAVGPLVTGNEMKLANGGAAAGFFGVPVGPGGQFAATNSYSFGLIMAVAGSYSVTWFFGPWANATNRYLGFKFLINGQTHYGWARMSVADYIHGGQVVLTGYAYETTPNTPIIEGHTHAGNADNLSPSNLLVPSSQPASLGMLALGADALALWRREDDSTPN
jgi:hypothetical protein